MAGCLPSFQRLLNPHKPRPYLPADEPAAIKTSVPRPQRSNRNLRSGIPQDPRRRDASNRPSTSRGANESALRQNHDAGRSRSHSAITAQQQAQQQQRGPRVANKKNAPTKGRGEFRPTGLFAGVKPPLVSPETPSSQHQPGAAIDQRIPPALVSPNDPAQRNRAVNLQQYPGAAPGWQPPRGWIVTTAGGQNARPGTSGPPVPSGPAGPSGPSPQRTRNVIMPSMQSMESLPRTVSPPERGGAGRMQDAALAASLVELPGSYMDFGEKEAVIAPSVRTMASYDTLDTSLQQPSSGRPSHLDSVIELPGSIPNKPKSRDSLMMAELPGSSPVIMEKDAGPIPPVELPASVPAPRSYVSGVSAL